MSTNVSADHAVATSDARNAAPMGATRMVEVGRGSRIAHVLHFLHVQAGEHHSFDAAGCV